MKAGFDWLAFIFFLTQDSHRQLANLTACNPHQIVRRKFYLHSTDSGADVNFVV